MSAKRPEFHLQSVDEQGQTSPLTIFAMHHLPGDVLLARRDFFGLGTTVAAAVAMLGDATDCSAQAPPAAARRTNVVFAHTDSITALAFMPDGKHLVSSGRDGLAKVWSLGDGKVVAKMEDHDGSIHDLAISADGTTLATASQDKTIRLWSLPAGLPLTTLDGGGGEVTSISFSRDGQALACGASDGKVCLWKVDGAAPYATLDTGHRSVNEVVCSPVYNHVATGGRDNLARFWSLADGTSKGDAAGHTAAITSLALSPDGLIVATGSSDKQIAVRKLADRASIQTLKGHTSWVQDLAFFAGGNMLASASNDATIKLWKLPDGVMTDSLKGPFGFTSLAVSPDNRLLAAGDVKGVITLWDLVARQIVGFLFDPEASSLHGSTLTVRVDTRIISYTLPCGSPIPAGATCTCNCVPGTYIAVRKERVTVKEEVTIESRNEDSRETATEARKRALQILREKRLRKQEEQAAAQQQAAMQYYYYMQQFYTPPASSSGSTTRCVCIPVYR